MSSQRVTVDNITDMQIKQLYTLSRYRQDDTLEAVCEQALAGDVSAIKAVVAEINDRAIVDEQRRRRATITTMADLIIELERVMREYQAKVAEISARIVDVAKGE